MFSYKIVNRVFGYVLVDESEMFVNFYEKEGVSRLPRSVFLVEVGPLNNDCAAFVGHFKNYVFAFF